MLQILSSELKFDSSEVLRDKWRELLREYQELNCIDFDTENDDAVGKIREIEISNRNTYIVELHKAGGDWQMPSLYFKIQGKHSKKMFVFVPSIEEGNGNFLPSDKKSHLVVADADDEHDDDLTDENKAWNAIKTLLDNRKNEWD